MFAGISVNLAFLVLAQAVPADGTPAGLRRMEWKVGEVTREALVALPPVTKNAPLVFVWHGHGGTMAQASRSFALHKHWPEAIVVYPQGLNTAGLLTDPEGKKPGWQSRPGAEDDRDLKFFDAMLAAIQRDLKSDPARVFATGHSNGGRFVYLLWATRGDQFAAFAPSASPATGLFPQLKPKPALHIAGSEDKLVRSEIQKATIDRLLKINACEADGKRWGEFSGEVKRYASSGKTPVLTATYPGGHVYPREAPEVTVKFFKNPTGE